METTNISLQRSQTLHIYLDMIADHLGANRSCSKNNISLFHTERRARSNTPARQAALANEKSTSVKTLLFIAHTSRRKRGAEVLPV